jgi:ribonuclease T2
VKHEDFILKITTLCATSLLLLSSSAMAQVKMSGEFTASRVCPALQSIKNGANPGDVSIEPGTAYHLLGKNKNEATHYWIEVPGASPFQRWVEISCGTTDAADVTTPPQPQKNATVAAGAAAGGAAVNAPQGTVKPKPSPRGFAGRAPYYAFALSWEPTFCEAMRDKAECRVETPKSFEATHFTLHGLWPQPRRNQFCNVDPKLAALDDQHQWDALPEPELTPATRASLNIAMPGTMSNLQRHEWIKHGTCYPGSNAEQYFKDEMRLAAEVNASPVQALFASNIGKQISAEQIRMAFNQGFGQGAGDHVQVECDKQGRLGGFTLNLRGDIPGGANLAKLLVAGDQAQNKCDGGMVDAVK